MRTHEAGGVLAMLLGTIHHHDVAPASVGPPNYEARNRLLLFAIGAAVTEGIPVGFLFDPAEPEWPCVMFELPTGQVGWHLPQHGTPYDGHDTRTKYERIRAFQEGRPRG
ncbi:MAG: hypothetical protein AUG49_16030 [Catenulispora sp. 13_1_20CM_3_70_7]|nr:MAG: hypothetical protein AUG49_16030 [Catenulispora sp. 13_1_20CM_3_70_7]